MLGAVENLVRRVERRCRGPLISGDPTDSVNLSTRAGCGYDFNLTILAGPMDGEVHDYKCPNCSVTGTYRAPRFD